MAIYVDVTLPAKRKREWESHRITIKNDGTGTQEISNYDVTAELPGSTTRFRIEGFERRRGYAALLAEVFGRIAAKEADDAQV
jgi:hypothetical protein